MELIPLFSGSGGNSLLVRSDKTNILIDAGICFKGIASALSMAGCSAGDIDGVLITHEHTDHIKGLEVLVKKIAPPVYLNHKTFLSSGLSDNSKRSVRFFEGEEEFCIGDISVIPFKTSHDSADPVGFSIRCGSMHILIATDTGVVTRGILDRILDVSVLYIESNYDEYMLKTGPYPYFLKKRIAADTGHLGNSECAKLCVRAALNGTRRIILSHLSRHNNTPELARASAGEALLAAGIPKTHTSVEVAPISSLLLPGPLLRCGND